MQLIKTETVCAIFKDNIQLCNEVTEQLVQEFVHSIETNGHHTEYLKFLQTIVKANGTYIRKCQDTVMSEVGLDTVMSEVGLDKVMSEVGQDTVMSEVGQDTVM